MRRRCLGSGLVANVGHPQPRDETGVELPLLTSGDDLQQLGRFLGDRSSYTARDVLDYLPGGLALQPASVAIGG